MKYQLYFILTIILLNSCGIRKEIAVISFSNIENKKIMLNEGDSLLLAMAKKGTINNLPDSLKVKLDYFMHYRTVPAEQEAQYPGGELEFKKFMMESIKKNIKNRVKTGETRVKFTISKEGYPELIVLKYKDKNLKNTLQNLEIKPWNPQLVFAERVPYQFEISVLITKKE